jgi:hypothetical protein
MKSTEASMKPNQATTLGIVVDGKMEFNACRIDAENSAKADEDGIKVGYKLMQKLGWKTGQRLGKNRNGLDYPLDQKFYEPRAGLGSSNPRVYTDCSTQITTNNSPGTNYNAHARTPDGARRHGHGLQTRRKRASMPPASGCIPPPRTAALLAAIEKTQLKQQEEAQLQAEMDKVPIYLQNVKAFFLKIEADKLPPHRPGLDHEIELLPGTKPRSGPLYNMTETEDKVLKQTLQELLSKGFIQESISPCSSPILFVKKADKTLRLCVDYRALNEVTKKTAYPTPLIDDCIDSLRGAKVFTKLDLRSAFNQLRVKQGHEYLTAFKTRYGLFEYKVLPFGLSTGLGSFQRFINFALRQYLGIICVAYIDDVVIYSKHA